MCGCARALARRRAREREREREREKAGEEGGGERESARKDSKGQQRTAKGARESVCMPPTLLLSHVFACDRMCSLSIECVLLR